jgi:hypothetical protein
MVNSYASKRVSVFEEAGVWTVLVHDFPSENKTFQGEDAQSLAVRHAGIYELGVYASSVVPTVDYQVVS